MCRQPANDSNWNSFRTHFKKRPNDTREMVSSLQPFSGQKAVSGGKVCHLESRLRLRFAPRSSGQITSAFKTEFVQGLFLKLVYSRH